VLEAEHGEACVEMLEAHEGDVSAVIMDLNMPRMDGREAAAIIAERWPSLPVLLTTGHIDPDVDPERRPKSLAFLHKPYDLEGLERALAALLEAPPEGG
jgi:CheY-like chemotaxis protein